MSEQMLVESIRSGDPFLSELSTLPPATAPTIVMIRGGRPARHPVVLEATLTLQEWQNWIQAVWIRNPDIEWGQAEMIAAREVLEDFEEKQQPSTRSGDGREDVSRRTELRHDPDCRRNDTTLEPGTACCRTTFDRVYATDETYYRGYEGACDICGEPANRRWTWPDGYAEDRCSKHWVSEELPERGKHPGIARIEALA